MPPKRPRPKATAASAQYAASNTSSKFDPRNPNHLAPSAAGDDDDEAYDAETAAILEMDEISGQSRGVKRNAVNLDGYDSDSSNEGFGGGKVDDDDEGAKSKKKKGKKGGGDDDDDDDMFGGDDDNDDDDGGGGGGKATKKGKKDVRFLDLAEIEGQENLKDHRGPGGQVSSDDDEEEEEDDDEEEEEDDDEGIDEEIGPGGKKKNAPKMDAFNMKGEMQEGKFDDQMNFVRKAADSDAIHDTWLQGVSKKEMKRAKESQDKRDQEAKQRRLEEDELVTGDIIRDLILCLERGETALEALARLNTGSKKAAKPKKSWQQKKKGGDMEVDTTPTKKEPEDPKETARKEAIENITTAADRLLSRGFAEIYDEPRENLTRQYTKETGDRWEEPAKPEDQDDKEKELVDEWEYKWDGQGDGEIHGPYGGTEMKAWKDAGYFQEGVVFRRRGEGDSDWTRLPDF